MRQARVAGLDTPYCITVLWPPHPSLEEQLVLSCMQHLGRVRQSADGAALIAKSSGGERSCLGTLTERVSGHEASERINETDHRSTPGKISSSLREQRNPRRPR